MRRESGLWVRGHGTEEMSSDKFKSSGFAIVAVQPFFEPTLTPIEEQGRPFLCPLQRCNVLFAYFICLATLPYVSVSTLCLTTVKARFSVTSGSSAITEDLVTF